MKYLTTSAKPFWTRPRYYLPLLIGVVANGLIYASLTYRLATKQERLTRSHTSLTESVATTRQNLQGLESERARIARNEETADRFFSEVVLPREPGLTDAITELDRLAEESGVERGATTFDYHDLEIGLVQASASMPLVGSYFDLAGFINRLERSQRFFLVQEIGLRRTSRDDDDVELNCDVSFFLKEYED
jgi:Tfp pilus assembly protein PilO